MEGHDFFSSFPLISLRTEYVHTAIQHMNKAMEKTKSTVMSTPGCLLNY